jgi:8-oxo-dGTP pyrophosphatase MutT (NUDIX family)
MKQKFAGGILYRDPGEVLLVLRSKIDDEMADLWSLPAGGIKPQEKPETALVREFREETGLDVEIGDKIDVIERKGCSINIYEVYSKTFNADKNIDKDIADVSFHKVSDLPERLVLDARIPILRYSLKQMKVDACTFTNQVEGLFSSLFYSYIEKELDEFQHLSAWSLINHTIINTPFRKFKSGLLYLMADCDRSAAIYSILAEILFAIWTIMDDICDARLIRYGKSTVLDKYGIKQSAPFLFIILKELEEFLLLKGLSSTFVSSIINSMKVSGIAQFEQFLHNGFGTRDEYLDRASRRTLFLRTTWIRGLNAIEKTAEASLLNDVHAATSITGQIINDFFDLQGNLEDFQQRRESYYSILLKEEVGSNKTDLKILNDCWNMRSEDSLCKFRLLISKFHIKEKMELEIAKMSLKSIYIVNSSELLQSKKEILISWIMMGFKHIDNNKSVSQSNYKNQLNLFINAFDSLCSNIL